jgi:hypothetical protein
VRATSAIDAVQRYPFLLTLTGLVVMASTGAALLDFVIQGAGCAHLRARRAAAPVFRRLLYCNQPVDVSRPNAAGAFLRETRGPVSRRRNAAVCIGLGSVAGLLLPGFPAVAGIRGMEILVRGSFYRTAYELFYAPMPPRGKTRRENR